MTCDPELCKRVIRDQPYPLLFVTVSGAHLYGFPSPDSDYDLRGVHVLPLRELMSLDEKRETVEFSGVVEGVEIDLVSHDLEKFIRLMLKSNGYVLEQLLSPFVVQTSSVHDRMCKLAPGCITSRHAYHYLGFAETQFRLFTKENPPRIKPLLYVYRVLLTGIHLMRKGIVEANLRNLNTEYALPYIDELIARKTGTKEQATLPDSDLAFHESEYLRLRECLEQERQQTRLPEHPTVRDQLNALLVSVRLGEFPN